MSWCPCKGWLRSFIPWMYGYSLSSTQEILSQPVSRRLHIRVKPAAPTCGALPGHRCCATPAEWEPLSLKQLFHLRTVHEQNPGGYLSKSRLRVRYNTCLKAGTVSSPSLFFGWGLMQQGQRMWEEMDPQCSAAWALLQLIPLGFHCFLSAKMKISLISQKFHLCSNMENHIIKGLPHYKLLWISLVLS